MCSGRPARAARRSGCDDSECVVGEPEISRTGLMGNTERAFQDADESQLAIANLWLLIVWRSPNAIRETGLPMCPPEKKPVKVLLRCRAVRSLQSGLSRENREIRAYFVHLAENRGRDSLHSRLRGGEGGIRTLGTGVSPYNGLARGSFSPPSLGLKHLQSDWMPLSRTQGLSFGNYCAPLCAPDFSCPRQASRRISFSCSASTRVRFGLFCPYSNHT